LQVSVSLAGGGGRPTIRLVADPASNVVDGQKRWVQAGGILSLVMASHAPQLEVLCRSVIRYGLPAKRATVAALPSGAIWLAADLSGQGMALYATAKWGDRGDRWLRTRRWLDEVLPDASACGEILNRLAVRATLVSVGVEGVTPENARAKLYWRLDRAAALQDLGLPLLGSPEILEFLAATIEDRRIPYAAIVGSVGFRIADGNVCDVKLDVCCHCVRRTTTDWMRVVQNCIAHNNLAELSARCTALLETIELAFIGFGMDTKRKPRLNIYFKRRS
jgi:hypothetical protein